MPTWRNIELTKAAEPSIWHWAVLGTAAAAAVAWLVAAGVRLIRRRKGAEVPTHIAARRATGSLAVTTSLLDLGAVALIALIPGLIDAGFIGWLDFPTIQRLALHIPLALILVLGALLFASIVGWNRGWMARSVRWQYAGLALASVLLVTLLASWDLVGWGWA